MTGYLEEHGIAAAIQWFQQVCQSCIYDLSIGRSDIRPDAAMGYAACQDAEHPHPVSGILGGGTGASVGKIYGRDKATKPGRPGTYAASIGDLKIAASCSLKCLRRCLIRLPAKKLPVQENRMAADSLIPWKSFYKFSQRTDQFR